MNDSGQLEGANAVRFYAALSIVLFHLIWLTKMELPSYLIFVKNYGGFGVPLFYMLSAFALSYGYAGKLGSTDAVKEFYLRRFFRIAPLFYFLLIAYPAYLWFLFGVPLPSVVRYAANATFTFNIIPRFSEGIVPASWSIGVEMLFYAIFPFLLMVIKCRRSAAGLFVVSLFVSVLWSGLFQNSSPAMKLFANFSLIAHMKYFSGGVLTYFLWRDVPWTPMLHRLCIALSCAVMVGLILFSSSIVEFARFLGLSDGGALYAFSSLWIPALGLLIAGLGFRRFAFKLPSIAAKMGNASFSIYLWHPILIGVLIHAGVYTATTARSGTPLAAFLMSAVATFALMLPVCWVSYEFIEKRLGTALRHFVTRADTTHIRRRQDGIDRPRMQRLRI